MKKLFSVMALAMVFATTVDAQVVLKSQYSNATDTVTNTGTKYLTMATPLNSYFKVGEVAVTVTEISGTTGGTVSVEGSLDGTGWYSVYSSADSTYTFVPTDVTTAQSYRFKLLDWADPYVRVKYVGTGTMSATISAKATFKN